MTTREYLKQLTLAITGDEIREARTALGLTQEEFGAIVGAHYTSVSRWERGEATPEMPGALKYAIEFFKLCDTMLNDEVFSTLDERIDEMTQLREKLKRDRAELREKLNEYNTEPAA